MTAEKHVELPDSAPGTSEAPLAAASRRLRRPPGRPPRRSQATVAMQPENAHLARGPEGPEVARTPAPPRVVTLEPALLGVAEAATYLSVSQWTVRDLVASGALPRVELPGMRRLLVRRADLDALIERSTR
jgi:excisionase family DNA binding protein